MMACSQSEVASFDAPAACWQRFTADTQAHLIKQERRIIVQGTEGVDMSANSNTKPVKSRAQFDTVASGFSYEDEMNQKLSRINGAINKMTKEQLQARLSEVTLNASGTKEVLKKRLKHYYKRQKLAQSNKAEEQMKYDYLIVIDFEATCSETNENFIHEIIEFPAVLVDARNKAVCNVFQRFCKPKINRTLTQFCTNLTGISQSQVDKAKDFKEVYKEFEEWLSLHGLGTEKSFAILTDGPWDMARFFKTQFDVSDMKFPRWAKSWINLRKAYTAFYGAGRVNLQHMLDDLGMTFQGRPHCGLDDSRNIAAISVRLMQDGCLMRVNEYLHEDKSALSQAYRSPPRSHLSQAEKRGEDEATIEQNIPQEGDNLEDLFQYMRIQQS